MKKSAEKFMDVWDFTPKMEIAIANGMNVGLRGPTSTGKTLWIRALAKQKGKKLFTFNMTVHTGVEELKGRYVLKPAIDGAMQLQWVDGQLVEAMRKGDWVVIEEANFMPEEISSVLYSVMDDRKEIILDEHENEVIKAHQDFRLFLTMNWGYRGTTYPNDAIKNRIDVWFDIPYLPPASEAALLADTTGISVVVANNMVQFAAKFREAKERILPDIGTRVLMRWASLVAQGMEAIEAAEITIIPLMYYEQAEKQKVRDALGFFFKAPPKEKKLNFGIGDAVKYVDRQGNTRYGVVKEFAERKQGLGVMAWWADSLEQAETAAVKSDKDAEGWIVVEKVSKLLGLEGFKGVK